MNEQSDLIERLKKSIYEKFKKDVWKESDFQIESEVFTDKSSITISGMNSIISLKLSLHHLDMPWCFIVTILENGITTNISDYFKALRNVTEIYEVYPKLLQNVDTLGDTLVHEISNDLSEYLRKTTDNSG